MINIKKLTIGMIIKNESENLERCLNALKPVLDNVKSELVIVDTGSEDNSIEIAKRYTKRVYNYTWTNDFAAARNESLKYAEGEWFMWLDADEFLEDSSEIIEFFNRGESKRYDAASYIVRNFASADSAQLYSDAFVLRMFRRGKGRVFKGYVHESVVTDGMHGLKMLSKSIFNHWGYCVDKDKEKYAKKLSDYEKLVRMELSEDPNNMLRYIQLSSIYIGRKGLEPNQSDTYSNKAIGILKEGIAIETAKQDCDAMMLCVMYKSIARILYHMENYMEIGEIYNAYFENKSKFGVGDIGSDLDMYFYGGIHFFETSKFDKAFETFNNYLKVYREIDRGNRATKELLSGENYTHLNAFFCFAVRKILVSLAKCGENSKIKDYISMFACEEDKTKAKYLEDRIDAEFEVMDILGYDDRLSDMVKRYSDKDTQIINYIISKLEEKICGADYKEQLLKILSECDGLGETYQNLSMLRYIELKGEELDWNCLEHFFSLDGYIEPVYGDVLYFAIKYRVNFDNIAVVFNPDITEKYISAMTINKDELENVLYERIYEDMSECDVSACLIVITLCREFMLKNNISNKRRIDFFSKYASLGFEYISLILNMENIDENSAYVLPPDIREMYLSSFALVEFSDGNYKEAEKYFKKISEFNSRFIYLGQLMYAEVIKESIDLLIENSELDTAKQLIEQYKITFGEDEFIKGLDT